MKIYLAMKLHPFDFGAARAFAHREDAEAYELAEYVVECELSEGPAEVRTWYRLRWIPSLPDQEQKPHRVENPQEQHQRRDFDGHPERVTVAWVDDQLIDGQPGVRLRVEGWDLDRVREAYREQRAQYTANQTTGAEKS